MTAIGVFRSRNQTLRFSELLKAQAIEYRIINTPREADVGCGISVEIDYNDLSRARSLLYNQPFSAFEGWFTFEVYGRQRNFRRV